MGLFDSIRRVVGGGQSTTDDEPADGDGDPELVDTRELDIEALRARAESVAGEVEQLDFTLASLEQFDAAIEAGYDEEIATPEDPETYAWDAFRFGCYLGEVLVRVYDGEWTRDPGWGVTLTGSDDTVTVSVFDVAERSIRTDPVFAAVTERAATEVGLDGDHHPPTIPDDTGSESTDEEGTDEAEPAAATIDDDTDEAEPAAATIDDDTDEAEPAAATIDDDTDEAEPAAASIDDDIDESPPGITEDGDEETDESEGGDSTAEEATTESGAPTTASADDTTVADDAAGGGASVPSGPDDIGTQFDDTGTGFEFGSSDKSTTTDTDDSDNQTDSTGQTDTPDGSAGDSPASADTDPAEPGETPSADTSQSADTADAPAQSESDAFTNPFEAATEPDTAGASESDGSVATEDTEPNSTDPDSVATADTEPAAAATDDAETGATEPADDEVSALVEEAEPGRSDDSTGADADSSLLEDAEATAGPTDDASRDGTAEGVSEAETDPTEGDGLRAEYAEEAQGFVNFWSEHDLDYTPDSLERLDALVAAEWDDDRFEDATFGSEETFDERAFTSVATELGSYFGEVLVRELDAEWSDRTANDGVVVEGPEGPLAIPVFRVAATSLRQTPVFAKSYASLLSDLDAD